MADHRRPGEIEIAKRVEQLVTNEFVSIAQPTLVEDGVAADHDGIIERAAARQTGRAHAVDLVQKAEGSSAADLRLEGFAVEIDAEILLADRTASEINLEAH